MKQGIAIGLDIGGTNCAFGLVDEQGRIIARDNLPTASCAQAEELVKALSTKIKALAKEAGSPAIQGIGVGAPNGNYYSGCIEFAPNLHWEGIIPIAEYFKKHLSCEASLTNDANAAAYGEMLFGAAKGMKDFLFITLGTGLGSGIVANGEMIYGHDGMAGEIGHTILFPDGRPCGCGRKGCLETYCSASGLVRTYREKAGSAFRAEMDAEYIFEKAKAGDALALESFSFTGEWLGFALANSVAYTSPEAIFLFGGLARAEEYIFAPTRQSFEKNLMKIYKHKIKILPSGLKPGDAAILGAASLIWKKSMQN
ncbi:MAG TPA: ROK family protein [Bacteroidia bacterium]|jgi:glucokinase|nr:ROK family protein [Bacteroidia bacterium]